jgi:hypothetical protein
LQPYTEGKYLSYDIGEMQINLNEDLEYRFLKMPFPEQKIPTFEPTEIERRLEPNVTFSTKEISYNETENI